MKRAVELMMGFCERTGLGAGTQRRRYLWTDAFAVCNFLSIARATGDHRYADLAFALIDAVHHTLGWHRPDDGRFGWLDESGIEEGEAHPTRGGLRIGKPLPERGPGDPYDERLEWDRDGQYFHYLTKWMHALECASRASGRKDCLAWARELARTAHDAFVYPTRSGRKRMVWKMSVDLKRPVVSSMGQHDPLDGYVTCLQLQAGDAPGSAELDGIADDYRGMIDLEGLETDDPLGLGGLLIDAYRLEQLSRRGVVDDDRLLTGVLAAAQIGLDAFLRVSDMRAPPTRRIAFRELGLAIGLRAAELMSRDEPSMGPAATDCLRQLIKHAPLASYLAGFWSDTDKGSLQLWQAHRDINEVMLATALLPDQFLILAP